MKLSPTTAAVGGGVVLAAGLAVWVWHKGAGGVAASVSRKAVDAVGGVLQGSVEGVGAAIGITTTDQDECQRALAEGRYWDASFACPLKDFVKGVVS